MTGKERVTNILKGKAVDRQPVYGWVSANLSEEITKAFGSVADFEDKYEFDMAHIFSNVTPYNWEIIDKLRQKYEELTPDILLDNKFLLPSEEQEEGFKAVTDAVEFYGNRKNRFCYVQTPGFFEPFNSVFGIENQLMYLALYPDEIKELYHLQESWNEKYAERCIELGADMIHISDDWGSQKSLMFSAKTWQELIYPNMKKLVNFVHSKGVFASLHSDGCVMPVADGIKDIGFDMVHPWQENAGMSYDTYLEKYSDDFAILGGVCIQSALGILPKNELEREIRRVFGKLKGKRWICCTTHFVQNHCTIEDLAFAYDLIYKLARE